MKHRALALLLAVLMLTALLPFGAFADGEKLIAVTFDDGPSQYTSQLLDGLAARGAKVTFFMQGVNAQNYPSIVRRAWNEGHQICSHTYNHPSLTSVSASEVRNQLSRTDSILDNALGFDTTYMLRPPYGNYNQTVLNTAGVPCFYWSVDTLDWKSRNADSVYSEFLSHARDGSIVLLHDLYPTSVTGALRAIDTLKSRGYSFVTVAELLYRRGITPQNAKIYFDCYPGRAGTSSALSVPVIQQNANPAGGLSVSITGDSRGTIYYTTNGETPNPVNSTKYTGPFTLNRSCTVKAVSVVLWNGYRSGAASKKVDYLPCAAPEITVKDGTMTMRSATAGATIRYTTNGSAPTGSSTVYTGPTAIEKGKTIKAIANANGFNTSVVSTITYTANGNLMRDVTVSDWYYPHLDRAVTMGILAGTAPETMSPNSALTRAMLVTILHRMAKPDGASKDAAFTDVAKTQYYYQPVCWASENEIVLGYPDNTFLPGKNISRAELCAMLARYLRSLGVKLDTDPSALNGFADKDSVPAWAKADIAAMVELGVVKGYNNNTIGASRGATRAEAVTMVLRAADVPVPEEPAEEPTPSPAPSTEPTESPEVTPAPTEEPAAESEGLQEVLDAVKNYHPGVSGSTLKKYQAAALLLNFLRTDDAKAKDLKDQIKAYTAKLNDDEQKAFQESADDVLALAQDIVGGDVTAEDAEAVLSDGEIKLDPVDPKTFPADRLKAFSDALSALKAK